MDMIFDIIKNTKKNVHGAKLDLFWILSKNYFLISKKNRN